MPAPGGSPDEEQAPGGDGVEVHLDGARERAEGRDLQAVQPHAAPSCAEGTPSGSWPSSSWPARSTRTASTADAQHGLLVLGRAVAAADVGQEGAADVELGLCCGPLGVAAHRDRSALRIELQDEGVREPPPELLHRAQRTDRVGQRDLAPRALGGGVRGIGEQVVDVTAQDGQRPLDWRVHRLDLHSGLADVDQPGTLGLGGLAERQGQGRTAVANASRSPVVARGDGPGRRSRCRRRPSGGRADTPPTEMSRSESLVAPPVTNAWAITTERPPRRARSASTRAIAARRTPAWERSLACRGSAATAGSR